MERIKINDGWRVWRDLDPFELVFRVPEDARETELPYDAMFHETQRDGTQNGGATGNIDAGDYKYYKRLFIPRSYEGGRVLLRFEGIYRNASVFVNQSRAGGCAYGYTDFTVDIGDYLRYGEENELLVAVKCGVKSSRWYSGAGIYRDVYLLHGGALCVKPQTLRACTLQTDEDGALLEVKALIANDSLRADTIGVRLVLTAPDGQIAADETYPVRVRSRCEESFRKRIYLSGAALWDAEHPNLYRLRMELVSEADGSLRDTDEIRFGIRCITADAKHGLRINGKTVKLRGACLHHDQGILGAATWYDYEYRRIRRLKEAGFNAVRSAHNPASQALLDACDVLGMYVMDELADVWNKSKVSYDYAVDFARSWESDITHMVEADYNHPSVILYSTGNEIFEICTEKGFETSRMLSDKFHELDPSRLTTNGINGAFAAGDGLARIVDDITNGQADTGKGDVNVFMAALESDMPGIVRHPILGKILEKLECTMDVIGYNYMTFRYRMDAEKYPNRVMIGTETYPKQIAENWREIQDCPAVLGDFTWTGWDFLGEVAPQYPALINESGDLTLIGERRPVSYYRELVFGLTKKPCIAVQNPARHGSLRNFGPWIYTDCTFNYRYEGQEGQPILIQVYAGGDSAELFLNGISLGVQPCGAATDYETQFETVYEPGELLAVAYENGKEIGRTVLKTSGEPAAVYLRAEVGEELIFVNVEVQDEEGYPVADAAVPLSIALEGDAKLLAFAGCGARHKNGFELSETVSGEGHALAILRRTGRASVRVRVSGDGLTGQTITI